MEYGIEIIAGEDHPKRRVVFLISDDRKVTAKKAFDCLDRTGERTLRRRFDMWLDNQPGRKRYHGFNSSQFNGRYTNCFVFKCGKHNQERFYGFLRKSKERNPAYEICILVVHIKKKRDETEESDLKDVIALSETIAVQKAIKNFFKEKL